MIEGVINKIIPFSSVDGPGNRTAIFLQGCNFNCIYCHNPETIQLCTGCGRCVGSCPKDALYQAEATIVWEKDRCCECDTCTTLCQKSSSPRTMKMDTDRLFEEMKLYKRFIDGITVSGGECTLQQEFLVELFTRAKAEGLTCMIDTNGSNDFKKMPELVALCDGFMLDVKVYDAKAHEKYIGAPNEAVLANLHYLASIGKLYEVRTVVVPELFDNEETVRYTASILTGYDASIRYKLIQYRSMGVREEGKKLRSPSRTEMNQLEQIAKKLGCKQVIVV